MKIVINKCYGGFSLSPKGIKRYLELKGKHAYFYIWSKYPFENDEAEFKRVDDIKNIDSIMFYCTIYNQGKIIKGYPKDIFFDGNIDRNDAALVQVVEELGNDAFGEYAKLVVENIPNGTAYRIREYDGYEKIEYRDEIDWNIAKD